jgi:hypothetical protein
MEIGKGMSEARRAMDIEVVQVGSDLSDGLKEMRIAGFS